MEYLKPQIGDTIKSNVRYCVATNNDAEVYIEYCKKGKYYALRGKVVEIKDGIYYFKQYGLYSGIENAIFSLELKDIEFDRRFAKNE